MKKTFITLLALAGVAMGETTDLLASSADWTLSSISLNDGVLKSDSHWGGPYAYYTLDTPITLNSNTSLELSYTMSFETCSDVGGTVTLHSSSDVLAFGAKTWNGSANDAPFCIGYSTNADAINANAITFTQGKNSYKLTSYTETDKTVGLTEQSDENGEIHTKVSHTIKETITWSDVEQKFVATIYIDGAEAGTQIMGDSYVLNKISVVSEGDSWKNSQPAFSNMQLTISTNAVPEPATATLSLLALAGLAARRRRH
ncbi:MAG: PEP-CTERM sorting domain-containing protein [Akkermansia sp.]|nr:PEP-CTERM sorting domain-containing protein [Akkermansia sp.]